MPVLKALLENGDAVYINELHSFIQLKAFLVDIATQEELALMEQLVEGKVDWKGRPARRGKHGGVKSVFPMLVSFAFENMATFCLSVNFVTYLSGVMHYDISDSANHVTNYMGTSFILAIIVAYLTDSHLGRYKAVILSLSIEFLGLGLLTIQAHYPKLKPPPCNIFDPTTKCKQVDGRNSVLLFAGMYALALGASGVKASLPTHGADQFDEKDPKEAQQMSSFFNWLLLALSTGAAVSLTLIVWIEVYKGWDKGFGLSAIAIFVSIVVFSAGFPRYRIHVTKGSSAMTELVQVYVAAVRNRKLKHPDNDVELYEMNKDKEDALEQEFLPHTQGFRWLDKAAIQTSTEIEHAEKLKNPWKLCRVTQVENAKIILGMVPVFLCTIIMTLCLAQLQTFSIQQGATMDTRITNSFNIPPASLPIIPIVSLLVLIPAYDVFFVPFARKFTGIPTGITHLQRVGVGLVLSCLSMAAAAIFEVKRKGVARDNNMLDAIPGLQPLPINVFWLSIHFFIFGIADMFTYVGLLEFFYSEAPRGLKSISTCFLWSSMALGFFLSTILVQITNAVTKNITASGGWLAGNNINRNHLNLFYWLLSLMSLINFVIYLFVSKNYKYRSHILSDDEVDSKLRELNDLGADVESLSR
ncbi:Proton-dependent oligopeptide transporter family [Heracleum sosnowskyi]|uniref:Proton-dependent oligopeptide transporter family n=1 Tax=Heracleum sosnowskyi TaxID=360622 RepID=A0AAD8HZ72_9APIA|nr:Proton-dependent oligopeptide transporter family [Heracleum sosnowskyi]